MSRTFMIVLALYALGIVAFVFSVVHLISLIDPADIGRLGGEVVRGFEETR